MINPKGRLIGLLQSNCNTGCDEKSPTCFQINWQVGLINFITKSQILLPVHFTLCKISAAFACNSAAARHPSAPPIPETCPLAPIWLLNVKSFSFIAFLLVVWSFIETLKLNFTKTLMINPKGRLIGLLQSNPNTGCDEKSPTCFQINWQVGNSLKVT